MSKYRDKHRADRQETLREYLAERAKLSYIIDNIEKIENLEIPRRGESEEDDIDYRELQARQFELSKLKVANDQRLKLLNKYLPDLKSAEIDLMSEGMSAIADAIMTARKRAQSQ